MKKTNDAFVFDQDADSDDDTAQQTKLMTAKGKSQAMEKSTDIAPTMLPADYRPSDSEDFMNPGSSFETLASAFSFNLICALANSAASSACRCASLHL